MGKLITNGFPTLEEIGNADHIQICRWYRFLRSGETKEEQEVMNKLCEKFKEGGCMTTEISKSIGWG